MPRRYTPEGRRGTRSRSRPREVHDDRRRERSTPGRGRRRRESTPDRGRRRRQATPDRARRAESARSNNGSRQEGSPSEPRRRPDQHRGGDRSSSQITETSLSRLSDAIVKGMDRLAAGRSQGMVSVGAGANIIGEFDPLTQDINDWVNAIDEYAYAHIYGWEDRTISHLALSKLRGPAETWYRGLPTHIFTWAEWSEMLRQNFKPKRDLNRALKNMLSCVPKPGQTLYEYVFVKLALIYKLKLPITSEDQVNLIMGGIADEQLKFAIETAGIKDPHILASHLKTLQKPVTPSSSLVSHVVPKGRMRCFKCNRTGHIKKDCDVSDDNPSSSKGKRLAIEYRNVNLIGHDTNEKFFKNVNLNGKAILCFIDFGSECSLITFNAAQTLHLKLQPLERIIVLSTLSGPSLIRPEYFARVTISVDDVVRNIEIYVVDRCVMGVELLIGQNFTELYDVEYIKTGNKLTFNNLNETINAIKSDEINLGLDDPETVSALLAVINEYPECVANNMADLGVTRLASMKILVTSDKPVTHRPRQYSDHERGQIRDIVDNLLRNGIIRESYSAYASRVLLVKKKNGENRLCVDYRDLNKITIPDRYPPALIEEHIRRLSGFKFFSSLDLFSGYYQIPMDEESIPLTAFVTQDGHYEFLRCPFGLTNAPAVFQRMINTALGQLRFSKVLVYFGRRPDSCQNCQPVK